MDHFNREKKRAGSFIVSFSLATALAVNPDFLVLAGRIWGRTGLAGGAAICLAAGIYLGLFFQHQRGETFSYPLPAPVQVIGLAVRIPALVFLSTGILVSAGFACNEIFLYWFPNFGFAFLMLVLAGSLQFFGRRVVRRLQVLFTLIPVSGLILLTVAGLFGSGADWTSVFHAVPLSQALSRPASLLLPLLFYVGFDLGTAVQDEGREMKETLEKAVPAAVLFTGALFVFWGLAMLAHVPGEKLSQTSIPHLIAARKILGEPGRIIMGLTIIFGSLAAVHALFSWTFHQVSRLFGKKSLFPKLDRPKTVVTLLTMIIGLMMGAGLAGSKRLESLIRISLILWVLFHVLPFFYLQSVRLKNRLKKMK